MAHDDLVAVTIQSKTAVDLDARLLLRVFVTRIGRRLRRGLDHEAADHAVAEQAAIVQSQLLAKVGLLGAQIVRPEHLPVEIVEACERGEVAAYLFFVFHRLPHKRVPMPSAASPTVNPRRGPRALLAITKL